MKLNKKEDILATCTITKDTDIFVSEDYHQHKILKKLKLAKKIMLTHN